MSAPENKFSDLSTRIISAAALAGIAILAIWAGGVWFLALCAAIPALMVWELATMLDQNARPWNAIALSIAAAAAVFLLCLTSYSPQAWPLLAFLAPLAAGVALLSQHRAIFVGYALLTMLAGFGFYVLRVDLPFQWLIWLVLVVIVSDVAGYFVGRIVGGAKFWPKISPKKTWSGTIAGWVGAAIVGAIFMRWLHEGMGLILLSVLTAFAAQMGDIAESAIKRKVGVKDSSNLIPGHGGFMDRFDAMIAALGFFVIWGLSFGFAPMGHGL